MLEKTLNGGLLRREGRLPCLTDVGAAMPPPPRQYDGGALPAKTVVRPVAAGEVRALAMGFSWFGMPGCDGSVTW